MRAQAEILVKFHDARTLRWIVRRLLGDKGLSLDREGVTRRLANSVI